jgi:hypothetical protein
MPRLYRIIRVLFQSRLETYMETLADAWPPICSNSLRMTDLDPVGLWVSTSKSSSPRFTVSSMTLGALSTTNGKADKGDDDGSDPWVSGLNVSRNLSALSRATHREEGC